VCNYTLKILIFVFTVALLN